MHSFAIKYVVDGETFLVLDVCMIDVGSPDKNNPHYELREMQLFITNYRKILNLILKTQSLLGLRGENVIIYIQYTTRKESSRLKQNTYFSKYHLPNLPYPILIIPTEFWSLSTTSSNYHSDLVHKN